MKGIRYATGVDRSCGDVFTWPILDLLEDEWMRRSKAKAAAILYCGFREGGPLRGRPKRPASDDEA